MADKPEVSVVMGVYNGEEDVRHAIDSILSQQGADFEFIIVNDGSTDGTAEILNDYAARDTRFRIIHQENSGLTKSLIRGCSESRGAFIARQDADDISLPGRLHIQAEMLRNNSQLAMISCWADWIGPEGEYLYTIKPVDNPVEATRKILYEKAGPPAHGTAMFRRDAYQKAGGYRSEFQYAQDSDLWRRLGHVGLIGYVQQPLYCYRVSLTNISGTKTSLQAEYDRLAHACHDARLAGDDEAGLLAEARGLKSTFKRKPHSEPDIAYFIGRCLASNRDRRALKYLQLAVQRRPLWLQGWYFFIWAYLTSSEPEPRAHT